MSEEEFIEALKEFSLVLTKQQLSQLKKFYQLLKEWNEKINLTRIINEEDVYLKHFYDSLTILKVVDLEEIESLCDVGTGAGFPGIVLKICFPHLKVVLIDSLNKRVMYLKEVIKELELENIEAVHTRGEDFHERFDLVTSRAVANIEILPKYTMHLLKRNGIFIAMKGNIEKELTKEVNKKISKRYQILLIKNFSLPKEESLRSLVVMRNKD